MDAAGPIDVGIRAVLAAAEALVRRLGLDPRSVPPKFAEARGALRGRACRLRTRRFGGGSIERATLGLLEADGRAIGCVLAVLPRPGSRLPILGVDLFAHGSRLGLVVADLSPTDPAFWAEHAAPLLETLHAVDADTQSRTRPAFTATTFSDRLLIGAARAGREGPVLDAVARFVEASAAALAQPGPGGPEAAARNRAWRAAMRENPKEFEGFARLFGEDWARAYLAEHLFPISPGPGGSPR